MLDDEEIPKNEDVTYLISPAPKVEYDDLSTGQTKTPRGSEAMIIFCIDISRSMSIHYEGVSRIKSVQMAILAQIEEIKKESPDAKVGLVTFNGGLFVIGDGSKDKIYLDG